MILSEADLVRWGRLVGRTIATPVFIGLRGGLGSGKSVLARAIARGAGVPGPVPSPTFNLVFRYPTSRGTDVVHMDLYRLRRPEELWELGWEELGEGDHVVLVEWPEKAGDLLPVDRWEIELGIPPEGGDSREIRVTRVGEPPHLPGFPMALAERGVRP